MSGQVSDSNSFPSMRCLLLLTLVVAVSASALTDLAQFFNAKDDPAPEWVRAGIIQLRQRGVGVGHIIESAPYGTVRFPILGSPWHASTSEAFVHVTNWLRAGDVIIYEWIEDRLYFDVVSYNPRVM